MFFTQGQSAPCKGRETGRGEGRPIICPGDISAAPSGGKNCMKKKIKEESGKKQEGQKRISGGNRREAGRKTPLGDHGPKVLPFPARGDEFYFRGVEKTEAGRHREALAELDRAIRVNPRDSDAYHVPGARKKRSRAPRGGPCGS